MEEKVYNFKDSNNLGKIGESIVQNYILSTGKEIIDVSGDKEYQDVDIDIIIITSKSQRFGVEIKTDYYDTGNIFFEIVSSINPFSSGCMFKTKSDFLYYFFIKTNELYILNTNKYREFVLNNMDRFKVKKVKNKNYESLGLLIPKEFLENNFEYYRKVLLQ